MYLYELHQHTAACSRCAAISPEDSVRVMQAAGYTGAVYTEHFYHGHTAIRRNIPWADFVHAYEQAYRRAKAMGDALDFDVLFGLEEWVGGGKEVLLYGITPALLYAHPEWREADLATICRIVHAGGGLVYQAHPFRVRDYITRPWEPLPPDGLDGIEGYNAGNPTLDNQRAVRYARERQLPLIAGSDAHAAGQNAYGILSPRRLRTEQELVQLLADGDYELSV